MHPHLPDTAERFTGSLQVEKKRQTRSLESQNKQPPSKCRLTKPKHGHKKWRNRRNVYFTTAVMNLPCTERKRVEPSTKAGKRVRRDGGWCRCRKAGDLKVTTACCASEADR